MDEMHRKILSQCSGSEWDQGNIDKNRLKHKVSPTECEQIFFNHPLVILDDTKHSKDRKTILCAWQNRFKKKFIHCLYRQGQSHSSHFRPRDESQGKGGIKP